MEAQLYLHRLEPSSFRTYTLVAENTISTAATDIQLTRGTFIVDDLCAAALVMLYR